MAKDWKSYERVIGAIFTKIYYPDETGEFRRTGALVQSGKREEKVIPGDLAALRHSYGGVLELDRSFPFSLECKTWKDIKHFFVGLYAAESEMWDWIEQATDDASHIQLTPLVIFKLYRTNNVCMLLATDFSKLKEMFGEPDINYYFLRRFIKKLDANKPRLLIFLLLSDFIEWIDWDIYRLKDTSRFIRSYIDKS